MLFHVSLLFLAAQSTLAFPFIEKNVEERAPRTSNEKRQSSCPFNPTHRGAAPYTSQYPYTGAKNGVPGSEVGGISVPAPGDTAHQYEPPGPNDIRGACPGLNALANHHFLSHDGITTFTELVDAQQNVFNIDYEFSTLLAVALITFTGDPITQKVSIGCDATSRTAALGSLLGREGGLSSHGKLESDASLTRNDYFLSPSGDNYSFNGTLFAMMQQTCQGNFDRDCMALYKYQRYTQSLADNGNFFFGPFTLIFYVAATLLYELLPNFGNEGTPDLATISSFFGAESDGQGGFRFNGGERIPPNWHNRRTPHTTVIAASGILDLYLAHPVLLGGKTSSGSFDALNFGSIKDGKIPADPATVLCLLYQIVTEFVPDAASLPTQVLSFTLGKLNPIFEDFGCPLKIL
ncbi:hypothetical protein MMC07_010000 [Pseudocyphellaria aurata]|nr:hypothetical protein [Pseudocyphellaria aurata]